MNGLLDEAQSTTASGRRRGFRLSARSAADKSGPRRLNLASLPSKVPWPMSTSHSSPADSLASSASAVFSCSRSVVVSFVSPRPRQTNFAPPSRLAFSQRPAQREKFVRYPASPGAPTTTSTVGRSTGSAALVKTAANSAASMKRNDEWRMTKSERKTHGESPSNQAIRDSAFAIEISFVIWPWAFGSFLRHSFPAPQTPLGDETGERKQEDS